MLMIKLEYFRAAVPRAAYQDTYACALTQMLNTIVSNQQKHSLKAGSYRTC